MASALPNSPPDLPYPANGGAATFSTGMGDFGSSRVVGR